LIIIQEIQFLLLNPVPNFLNIPYHKNHRPFPVRLIMLCVVCSSFNIKFYYSVVNTESYVDRSSRRASRAAWKQSQCVASGQTGGGSSAASSGGSHSSYHHPFSSQQSINRPSSALSHSQQSSVSISSGSVSSIASSLATSGPTGIFSI